jgi:hypothetical protein
MNLNFRINLTVEQDETASTEQMIEWRRQYDAFVASRRTQMPSALWRYFGIDSFHDGQLNSVTFDGACRNLELNLSCPNVKFFHTPESKEFEFLTVDFVARFEGVYTFALEQQQQELPRNIPCPTFLYAEVETAEEEIREANERTGEEHHSLIIKADVLRAGIVFHYLHVTAVEPTATAWMMRDSRFKFPFQE